jgi:hypothetical protein
LTKVQLSRPLVRVASRNFCLLARIGGVFQANSTPNQGPQDGPDSHVSDRDKPDLACYLTVPPF